MAAKREYDPNKNERDCNEFLKLIFSDMGEEKAYGLLRKNPDLMEYLRFSDLSDIHQELRRALGDRPALYFAMRSVKLVRRIFEEEIPLMSALDDAGDASRLDEFLRGIDGEHKQMLNEMGE